ncbi:hypothetical protein [Salinarimonas rosea]|uniref:hypothetical protein n=1 Tax=Salinarimonas rosea TaxID=552063 RepID=UPI00040A9463|nr:hypothetical protein [Salinarimonas rosea]
MLHSLCLLLYVLVLLPIWAVRRLTGGSRFGRRFHAAPSAWDRPVVRVAPVTVSSRTKGR